jgi:hypothetical protein
MTSLPSHNLVVFHGELNPQRACVYVRSLTATKPGTVLRGQLRGPHSRLTRTLAATVPLSHVGAGPTLLGQAVVPDPCYWEAGRPYLYDVDVALERDGQLLAAERRTLGLRSLGVHAGQLLHASRPYRLLACRETSVAAAPWSAWRAAGLARAVTEPSEELCRQASEEGVLLIAELAAAAPDELLAAAERLGKWAAVAVVVLPGTPLDGQRLRERAPNVLLAEARGASDTRPPSTWAQLLVCDGEDAAARCPAAAAVPWIARWPAGPRVTLEEAGEQLRRRQADRAGWPSCAGCWG